MSRKWNVSNGRDPRITKLHSPEHVSLRKHRQQTTLDEKLTDMQRTAPAPLVYHMAGKLPGMTYTMTDEEQKRFDILKEKAKVTSYDTLKKFAEKCYKDKILESNHGHLSFQLLNTGKEAGLSVEASEAVCLDAYKNYQKSEKERQENDPVNIALREAVQQKRDDVSLRYIAFELAKKGVPQTHAINTLADRMDNGSLIDERSQRYKTAVADIQSGYDALNYSFSNTPGAAMLADTPTAKTLLDTLSQLAETPARCVDVAIFDRLITMLIDNEAGRLMMPCEPYQSPVDKEIEAIKANPTTLQLQEAAHRVAITENGLQLAVFERLCKALQDNQ